MKNLSVEFKTIYDALIAIAREQCSDLDNEQLLAVMKKLETEMDLNRDYTPFEYAVLGAEAILALQAGTLSIQDYEPGTVWLNRKYPNSEADIKMVRDYDEVFG